MCLIWIWWKVRLIINGFHFVDRYVFWSITGLHVSVHWQDMCSTFKMSRCCVTCAMTTWELSQSGTSPSSRWYWWTVQRALELAGARKFPTTMCGKLWTTWDVCWMATSQLQWYDCRFVCMPIIIDYISLITWLCDTGQPHCSDHTTVSHLFLQLLMHSWVICTGWRFHSGCSTSLLWLFIGVFVTELEGTSLTAVCQSPKFPAANISGQPSQTEYSAVSSQYFWHLGFLSGRPNSLSDSLCDPAVESERFRWDLKMHLFARH